MDDDEDDAVLEEEEEELDELLLLLDDEEDEDDTDESDSYPSSLFLFFSNLDVKATGSASPGGNSNVKLGERFSASNLLRESR